MLKNRLGNHKSDNPNGVDIIVFTVERKTETQRYSSALVI